MRLSRGRGRARVASRVRLQQAVRSAGTVTAEGAARSTSRGGPGCRDGGPTRSRIARAQPGCAVRGRRNPANLVNHGGPGPGGRAGNPPVISPSRRSNRVSDGEVRSGSTWQEFETDTVTAGWAPGAAAAPMPIRLQPRRTRRTRRQYAGRPDPASVRSASIQAVRGDLVLAV